MKCETYVEEAVEAGAKDEDVLRILGCERPGVAVAYLLRIEGGAGDEGRWWDRVRLEIGLYGVLSVHHLP